MLLVLAFGAPVGTVCFESRSEAIRSRGFRGVSDMVAMFTTPAVGMLVTAAAVRR
jgi:hypothetical protein